MDFPWLFIVELGVFQPISGFMVKIYIWPVNGNQRCLKCNLLDLRICGIFMFSLESIEFRGYTLMLCIWCYQICLEACMYALCFESSPSDFLLWRCTYVTEKSHSIILVPIATNFKTVSISRDYVCYGFLASRNSPMILHVHSHLHLACARFYSHREALIDTLARPPSGKHDL